MENILSKWVFKCILSWRRWAAFTKRELTINIIPLMTLYTILLINNNTPQLFVATTCRTPSLITVLLYSWTVVCQTGAPTALRLDEVVLAVRSIGPGRAPGPCGPANQVWERIESGLGQNRELVLYCSGWRWSAGGVGGSNLPVATVILSSKIWL